MISAVVLTKNEEKNIEKCLENLLWCDEILVVDDGSTDRTKEIAEKLGARVVRHLLNRDFARQRNFALEKAKGEWILFVDADEEVSPELSKEIQQLAHHYAVVQACASGFYFKRFDFFMGRWLRHGEVGGIGGFGGVKILRLAKKNAGRWRRKVDEIWEIEGKTKVLSNPLLHFSHPTLKDFLESINEWSTLNAEEFFNQGCRPSLCEWFKPFGKFIRDYFLKFGFLDRAPGFVFAVLMSLHSFLVRGKLYLLLKKEK